jgi:putative transposase
MAKKDTRYPGGYLYQVQNRAGGKKHPFMRDPDFLFFENTLVELIQTYPVRLLGYVLMRGHFHLVLHPTAKQDIQPFVTQLMIRHTADWRGRRELPPFGHLWQGQAHIFPVEDTKEDTLTLLRYVEGNPKRAKVVDRAQDWPYGSLFHRMVANPGKHGEPTPTAKRPDLDPLSYPPAEHSIRMAKILSPWPFPEPKDYLQQVNRALPAKTLNTLRLCVRRSRPYGSEAFMEESAEACRLTHTIRPPGRPKIIIMPRITPLAPPQRLTPRGA